MARLYFFVAFAFVVCDPPIMFHEYIDKRRVRYEISDLQIENATFWQLQDSNPPLAVRDAIAIAKKAFANLESEGFVENKTGDGSQKWNVLSVSLVSSGGADDRWYYSIRFNGTVSRTHATIIVLMDGSWLRPLEKLSD